MDPNYRDTPPSGTGPRPDRYYLHLKPEGSVRFLWQFDGAIAQRMGVTNPEGGPHYFKARQGETLVEVLSRHGSAWFGPNGRDSLHEMKLAPGHFHPRMARPSQYRPQESPGFCPDEQTNRDIIAVSRGQLAALTHRLERICQTIHPSETTFHTFGHEIRNLLILACTEVEAHWRGILVANGMTKKHFNRSDYVKLAPAMRLAEYSISFPSYPWLKSVRPFENWGQTDRPIKALVWYDAYNAVKHDRESNFRLATLENAFYAVSACVIMICAQFGSPKYIGSELGFFQLTDTPNWRPSETYLYPHSAEWTPSPYSF